MIISPPFLPDRQDSESDEAFVERAMAGGPFGTRIIPPGEGIFPVSYNLGWHGGLHLPAPMAGMDVRAIADGTVVYARASAAKPETATTSQATDPDSDDPLLYLNGWTSNGVVIIKHSTEIGATALGAGTTVEYYSISMHLDTLADGIANGATVYRKDPIGKPGSIYGHSDRIHFEIVCDDANLQALINRQTGKVSIEQDGRIDSVWGDLYFVLPSGTPIFADDLAALQKGITTATNAVIAKHDPLIQATDKAKLANKALQDASAAKKAAAQIQKDKADKALTKANDDYQKAIDKKAAALDQYKKAQQTPAYTTTETLIVGIHYEKGDATLTTYKVDGTVVDNPIPVAGFEYDLYTHATALYPDCPSAGYELLRFGRILGPDALNPPDAAHWRQIAYPGGQGTVNLAPDTIKKFSDADFPQWRGWMLVDDDTNGDSRCDSNQLQGIIFSGEDRPDIAALTRADAHDQLIQQEVQTKLRRAIAKFPTEWDASTIEKRWEWIHLHGPAMNYATTPPVAMTPIYGGKAAILCDVDYNLFIKHGKALCFWTEATAAGLTLAPTHWHFDPREFIKAFKKCGWLSNNELLQTIPKSHRRLRHTDFVVESLGSNGQLNARIQRWSVPLNISCRKYGIDTPIRRSHFLANVYEETGFLRLMAEGDGSSRSYAPWWGRGLIQLTHLDNYKKYGQYRGFASDITSGSYAGLGWNPDDKILNNDQTCMDTAVYWINPKAAALGRNVLIDADKGLSQDSLLNTARSTNGNVAIQNLNGLDSRLQGMIYLQYVLTDKIRASPSEAVIFSWRKSTEKTGTHEKSDGTVVRVYEVGSHSIRVDISLRKNN